ncbi:hypothetical protein NECID01_1653 [Nematocida sp. AWRm77]|nr:hypothetical protein NECID01_1653 [Nematocida sp. AWRm77]
MDPTPKETHSQTSSSSPKQEDNMFVSSLQIGDGSAAILNRVATKRSLFYCVLCKEVILQSQTQTHMCTKIEATKDVFFYDKYCAVEDDASGTKCTRSLNCKSHSIHTKRAVKKRSAPFDLLLKHSMEEKRKRKIDRGEEKPDKKEKITDECTKLEEYICSKILGHDPVIEKTFCLPEIKFDTLAIRSMFFQPLKTQRALYEKKNFKGHGG